jgi:hypothetical protein
VFGAYGRNLKRSITRSPRRRSGRGTLAVREILLGTRRRPASDADEAFCFELNEASMRKYVEPIYGWDADVQRAYHARWFQPARLTIVEDDDAAWNRWSSVPFRSS